MMESKRFAYADPPYIGEAKRRYGCDEIDHQLLINKMEEEFDGWALSCGTNTLRRILPMCPPDIRIAAWVKPFCIFKPNVNPAYAWEPVIFKGGRSRWRYAATVRDWVSVSVTLKKGLCGAKPKEFNMWIIQLLGIRVDDDLIDLFPGTGGMGKVWEEFKKQ